MNVTMIGAGRVGLVGAACLAELGLNVHCVDKMAKRIDGLREGTMPFREPGLAELVRKNARAGRLSFSTSLDEAVDRSLVLFIAVGTEDEAPGRPNLKDLFEVGRQIARVMKEYKVLAIKSTVPPGTARRLAAELKNEAAPAFDIVSNPEFLREGSAIENFMRPDRVVLGGNSQYALAIMRDIYRPLYLSETPIVTTDNDTAELAKYACNAFLSVKISFINEMANICDSLGLNVSDVARVLGLDRRIGPKFLHAGPGFGGSCLPKDTRALIAAARGAGCEVPVVEGAYRTNQALRAYLVDQLKSVVGPLGGRLIGVLGLSYKAGTDDVRESPAIEFVRLLLEEGATVQAFDPAANGAISAALEHDRLRVVSDPYEAAAHADAVTILTEWGEFRDLDLRKLQNAMDGNVIQDTRNIFRPDMAVAHGFVYLGRGRGTHGVRKEPRSPSPPDRSEAANGRPPVESAAAAGGAFTVTMAGPEEDAP